MSEIVLTKTTVLLALQVLRVCDSALDWVTEQDTEDAAELYARCQNCAWLCELNDELRIRPPAFSKYRDIERREYDRFMSVIKPAWDTFQRDIDLDFDFFTRHRTTEWLEYERIRQLEGERYLTIVTPAETEYLQNHAQDWPVVAAALRELFHEDYHE